MSIPILIIGDPGTGKSRSTKTFHPGEVEILNTDGKLMPYFDVKHDVVNIPELAVKLRKRDGGATPLRVDIIRSWLNKHRDHKSVVVDDYGYALFEIYERYRISEDEKLDNTFEVFDMILGKLARQFREVQEDCEADRIVYFTMHLEIDKWGRVKPLVQGKAVNDKYVLEGRVTCTLQSAKVGDDYVLYTNNGNPAKSPEGLFEPTIPNDLRAVDTRIREAYGIAPLKAVVQDDAKRD